MPQIFLGKYLVEATFLIDPVSLFAQLTGNHNCVLSSESLLQCLEDMAKIQLSSKPELSSKDLISLFHLEHSEKKIAEIIWFYFHKPVRPAVHAVQRAARPSTRVNLLSHDHTTVHLICMYAAEILFDVVIANGLPP